MAKHMKNVHRRITVLAMAMLLVSSGFALAADKAFTEAEAMWQKNMENPGFDQYIQEFAEYQNSLHVDTKDGCYGLLKESVILFLTVTDEGKVTAVVANKQNQKAACFIKSYLNLPAKKPPFSPLVMRYEMKS
jgi:hypothetical protein